MQRQTSWGLWCIAGALPLMLAIAGPIVAMGAAARDVVCTAMGLGAAVFAGMPARAGSGYCEVPVSSFLLHTVGLLSVFLTSEIRKRISCIPNANALFCKKHNAPLL